MPRLPCSLDPLIAGAKRRMWKRRVLVAVLVVVLVAGAIGVSSGLRDGGSHKLPAALLKLIRSGSNKGVTGKTVEVYGPSSRSAINKATSGAVMKDTAAERNGVYLIVFHGHFEGPNPSGGPLPHYTILENVWSVREGFTGDYGVSNRLPAAVSRLGGPIVVSLKR